MISKKTCNEIQKYCAWSGIVFCVLYGVSFLIIPHNCPPPDPAYTAQELVDNWYLPYRMRIMVGMSIAACAGILYFTWCTQLTVQMWRREPAPILSLLQIGGGIMTTWIIIFCPVMWILAAELAGTVDAETIRTLHFLSWYFLDDTYWITSIECIAVFLMVMTDKEKPLLMPKWAAWVGMATAFINLHLSLVPFFKDGPFAIDGFMNFGMVFLAFGVFTAVTSYYLAVDLKRVKIRPTQAMGEAVRL